MQNEQKIKPLDLKDFGKREMPPVKSCPSVFGSRPVPTLDRSDLQAALDKGGLDGLLEALKPHLTAEVRGPMPHDWVNVYPDRLAGINKTKECADIVAHPNRIACRHLVWNGQKLIDVTDEE